MKTLSSLGIGLSLVFGCLLLAFVAELYYLLWWKKRVASRDIEDGYSSSARELFHLLCSKKSSLGSTELDPHIPDAPAHDSDDMQLKPFEENGLETEIMRLQNLCGPPRLLFTIKEETKEDLESDDGKSKATDDNKSRKGSRGRSLSDLLLAVETPYLTPLSSPPFFTPPLTPLDYYHQHGFNPLFESSTDTEINRMKASPPPKFKFLKDAEEKLYRKILVERAMKNTIRNCGAVEECGSSSSKASDEEDGSFITIIIGKSKDKEQHHHHHIHQQHQQHSTSSQVLPLPSSPSDIRPANTLRK